MYRVIRSVLVFSLVTVLASCEYWNKDMLGYLEYWSSTVQMGRVEVTDVTIQKNDSGADTIPTSSTPTITGYIINPQSYPLVSTIGDLTSKNSAVRLTESVKGNAQIVGQDPTMLRIKLNPSDSSLEHTDFRVDFEAIRQETMQSAGEVMGVTLRYNTPPIAPTPIIKTESGEYKQPATGQVWEAYRDGNLYWAYDDSIKDEKDPNCAKWFTINGTRHLVAECKVPNEQVAGLSIFQFKTDYSNITVAAVDVEGVSSSTLTSGQAVPPATYIVKYDANGATGGSVPSPQYKTQYKDITLATNDGNLTRIGYRFSGWNTSPDGTGTPYAEGATYSADAGVTLYAKWEVVNTVTFTPSNGAVDHGESVTLTPPKAGATIHYSTDGGQNWKQGQQGQSVTIRLYNSNNPSQPQAGEYVGIPEGNSVTITAYARYADGSQSTETTGTYSLEKYTVTYDGNSKYGIESTVSGDVPQKQEFYSGASIIIAEQGTLKRVAHTFGGWNTKNDGSGETYNAGDLHPFTGDTPLYAKWVPMTDFYVSSSTGSDQDLSHDGSESKPFKTIGRALHFINQFNNGTQSFIIHVEGTFEAKQEDVSDKHTSVVNIAPDKTLTLTIQGKDGQTATINAKNHGRVMYVGGKANVTLKNIELIGGVVNGFGGGVYIAGGTLTMKTGSSIKNNIANDQGGGVYIAGGTFTMETGSSINGNTASSQGGGVSINNGEFNMTGGTISGNRVTSGDGGGVFVKDTSSTFKMSGGTIGGTTDADKNTASGNGGGVYSTGILTMSGGTIIGNTATTGGGVMLFFSSTFTMSGGTIIGNTATTGGGVYHGGTYFYMKGSAIVVKDNDVYLLDDKIINVSETLTGNSPVATITPAVYSTGKPVLSGVALAIHCKMFEVTPDTAGNSWHINSEGKLDLGSSTP